MTIVSIFLASGIGAILRYLVQTYSTQTNAVIISNLLGCFLMGGLFVTKVNQDLKTILAIGLCGGLTTFSSLIQQFSSQSEQSQTKAILLIATHVLGDILVYSLGAYLTKKFFPQL